METAFRSPMRRYVLPVVLLLAACSVPSDPGTGEGFPPQEESDPTQFVASERSPSSAVTPATDHTQLPDSSVRIDPKR